MYTVTFDPGELMSLGSQRKRFSIGFFLKGAVLSLFFAFLLSGCTGDPDTIVVDFHKTVPTQKRTQQLHLSPSLRVAVGAMVSPKETFIYYQQLIEYIGMKMGMPIDLVQRKTYGEINQLLGRGEIDLAFICSGPYAGGKEQHGFEVLAAPQVQGSHFYRSYLIVNRNQPYRELEDLRGRVFAFTDPESNTGRLAPTYWLKQIGEDPERFFAKVIYTYSHDNSILAVGRGLVDGAAVDGLVWEYFGKTNPELTRPTRIIKQSEPYAIPPVVASGSFPEEQRKQVSQILVSMHLDSEGRRILDALMIDRFVVPPADWFESVKQIQMMAASLKEGDHGSKEP
jgi:phosphonate transport system substrate-binding protein